MKWTQREIKNHYGANVNNYSFEQLQELRATTDLEKIAVSMGISGMNGALLQDRNTGDFYKVTARNTALFYLV